MSSEFGILNKKRVNKEYPGASGKIKLFAIRVSIVLLHTRKTFLHKRQAENEEKGQVRENLGKRLRFNILALHKTSRNFQMKTLPLIIVAVTAAIVISGCVSVNSAVDKDFHKTISKVYVEVYSNSDMESYFHDLGTGLQKGLHKVGIQSEVKEIGPLALVGTSEIEKEIDSSGSDVVLVAGEGKTKEGYNPGMYNNRTGAFTGGTTYTSGSEMTVALYEPHKDKPVWKATVSISTGGFGMGSGSSAAGKIIEKLQEDKLIPLVSAKADTTQGGK